jgi:magnesium-transporting ATPase (P-type)
MFGWQREQLCVHPLTGTAPETSYWLAAQVLVASAAGARRGLLLRGGDVLEAAASVDAVVLDKTGTLTHGRLQLTAAAPRGEHEHNLSCQVFFLLHRFSAMQCTDAGDQRIAAYASGLCMLQTGPARQSCCRLRRQWKAARGIRWRTPCWQQLSNRVSKLPVCSLRRAR